MILHLDKFVHAGIFTVFTVLWLRTRPAAKRRYLWILWPGRRSQPSPRSCRICRSSIARASSQDFMADFAGVLFGFPLFHWIEQKLKDSHMLK